MEPLTQLYPPPSAEARKELLRRLRGSALGFGAWNQIKGLAKRLEADPDADPEVLGIAYARLDAAPLGLPAETPTVAQGEISTLTGFHVDGDRIALVGNVDYSRAVLKVGVLDPENALRPRFSPPVDVPHALRVALVGDIACVFLPRLTLRCFSVSDTDQAPTPRGSLRLESGIVEMFGMGGRLVILTGADRGRTPQLIVADVTLPNAPAVTASLAIESASWAAPCADGRHVVVLCGATGFRWGALPSGGTLRVVDLADPAKPRLVAHVPLAATTAAVDGARLVAAVVPSRNEPAALVSVDLSDPARPRLGARVPFHDTLPARLALHGDVVYGVGPYGTGWARDLSVPDAPLVPIRLPSGMVVGFARSGERLFAGSTWRGISVWDLSRPTHPRALGSPPSDRTLGYMKRRARRHLKRLAATDPSRYVAVAAAMLGEGGAEPFTGQSHWVTHFVLYGASGRFSQASHGRGAMRETTPRGWTLRTREGRALAAWDARPELTTRLYRLASVPWQTAEFALQSLRATGAEPPALSVTAARRHLDAPSPLLNAHAVRAALALEKLPPELAARVLVRAPRDLRAALVPRVLDALSDRAWADAFVGALVEAIGNVRAGDQETPNRLSRRQIVAARFLATHLRERVGPELLLALAPLLLASGEDAMVDLVAAAARGLDGDDLEEWLDMLGDAPEGDGRERVLAAIEDAVRGREIEGWVLWDLVGDPRAFVRGAIWRLLAASATDAETLLEIFDDQVFSGIALDDAMRGAFASPYALGLLERAGIDAAALAQRLAERPFLIDAITPDAFRAIVQNAPASVVLTLIRAASDAQWRVLRRGWLDNLREGVGVADAWSALARALDDDDGRLAARTIDDPEIADALLFTDAIETVLEVRRAEMGALLGRFVAHHRAAIVADDPLLLQAATHPLPEVRTPALEAVRARAEISLPFALRLLECEVPASVAVGAAWFDATPPGDPQEMRRVLALCDSPVRSVQGRGRDAIRARRGSLPLDAVCAALFEHADPQMQAFAAALASEGDLPAETPRFDAQMLRTRHRARAAREVVKRRQEAAPSVDTDTLLALARGQGTPRDADWALAQLVRRALAGETIEGLELK